ncbi:class I SAM-dependent methyltransferase [Methylobacterium sp. CM6257]
MFPFHHEFLQFLKIILRPSIYLEIGVATGRTLFDAPRADLLIGVDPEFNISENIQFSWHAALFRIGSDEFFEKKQIQNVTGKPVDFTFVDGMHHAEFVIRDIRNAESISHNKSVIAVHDIYPKTAQEASREQNVGAYWMGDVFKATHVLRKFRPDLKIVLLSDIPPSGMAVIYNLDPDNKVLFERYDEILDAMAALDYDCDFSEVVLPTFSTTSSECFKVLVEDLFKMRRY